MSQPKIMVFHLKELLYALILLALGILLLVLFLVFLLPKFNGSDLDVKTASDSAEETSVTDTAPSSGVSVDISGSPDSTSAGGSSAVSSASAANSSSDALYCAGIYTSSYVMNNQTMEIEVILDENHITSIRFVNVDDAVETVSPLLLPAMENVAEQIVNSQSFDGLTAPEGSEYTYQVLIEAIRTTVAKGEVG